MDWILQALWLITLKVQASPAKTKILSWNQIVTVGPAETSTERINTATGSKLSMINGTLELFNGDLH